MCAVAKRLKHWALDEEAPGSIASRINLGNEFLLIGSVLIVLGYEIYL